MANETYEQSFARRLSPTQRNCLIEHAAGPLPLLTDEDRPTKMCLIEVGLLCASYSDAASRTSRPHTLRLTDPFGRQIACLVLAQMAEQLIADGAFHSEYGSKVVTGIITRITKAADKIKMPSKWQSSNDEGGKRRIKGRIASERLLELLHAEGSVQQEPV